MGNNYRAGNGHLVGTRHNDTRKWNLFYNERPVIGGQGKARGVLEQMKKTLHATGGYGNLKLFEIKRA